MNCISFYWLSLGSACELHVVKLLTVMMVVEKFFKTSFAQPSFNRGFKHG